MIHKIEDVRGGGDGAKMDHGARKRKRYYNYLLLQQFTADLIKPVSLVLKAMVNQSKSILSILQVTLTLLLRLRDH